jgi:cold shock CspA family protein
MNGTIKRLVSAKGFGFILGADGNDTFPQLGVQRDAV